MDGPQVHTQAASAPLFVTRGLVAPEAAAGTHRDVWTTDAPSRLADGEYTVEAVFVDNSQRAWQLSRGEANVASPALLPPVVLGDLRVSGSQRSFVPR
jgi:hypothetical protein